MTNEYIELELDNGTILVKLDEEGVVLDVFDENGQVIKSTYKLYSEMGIKVVKNSNEKQQLERRLASNINFLGELKTTIGSVVINKDENITLSNVIQDLEDIGEEILE